MHIKNSMVNRYGSELILDCGWSEFRHQTSHAPRLSQRPRRYLIKGAYFLVFIANVSCHKTLYPDGYAPRDWVVVVSGDQFLAFRLPNNETSPKTEREHLPSVPVDMHWQPLGELDKFDSEHWRREGTQMLLVPFARYEPGRELIRKLVDPRGMLCLEHNPLVDCDTEDGIRFRSSLPVHPENCIAP